MVPYQPRGALGLGFLYKRGRIFIPKGLTKGIGGGFATLDFACACVCVYVRVCVSE